MKQYKLKLTLRLKKRSHEGIQDIQIQNLEKCNSLPNLK